MDETRLCACLFGQATFLPNLARVKSIINFDEEEIFRPERERRSMASTMECSLVFVVILI